MDMRPAGDDDHATLRHQPQSHLVMEKVVLENFKSYGGTHTIGPFHSKFTAIVGPNGCGKSNIIDAMLFVFGRRAQQLRHKTLAGLIHKSAAIPNAERASVTVYFHEAILEETGEDEERLKENAYPVYTKLPGTEFTVSREAFIDGGSRYSIDGRTVTQKDVVQLLKGKGIDLDHNRFLILQGEVEHIAMMKPRGQKPHEEGLLEYLEDIIGSNKYISLIEDTKSALTALGETIQEKREKLQAVQSQLDALHGPLELAQQVCDAERQVLQLKTLLEQKAALKTKRQMQQSQDRFDETQSEWTKWKQSCDAEKKEIAALETSVHKQREIVKKAEQLWQSIDAEFQSLERLDNELAAKQAHSARRARTVQKEVQQLSEELASCQTESEALKKKAKELYQGIPALQARTEQQEAKLEQLEQSLQKEFDVLRAKKNRLDNELQPCMVQLSDITAQVELVKAQLSLLDEKRETAQKIRQAAEEKFTTSQHEVKLKQEQLASLAKTSESLKKTFAKKREEANALREALQRDRTELQNLKRQADTQEQTVQQGRQMKTMIPRILMARDQGILPGVIDRLWSLGSVSSDAEVAMAAVAGNEYIVVETTEHAEGVVNFVRKHDLGRVTCIVLSRVRELKADIRQLRTRKLPDGAKLLLDEVKPTSPEYETAFFFALRDVLLVSTLDEARAVAFGGTTRWRVVTREGQIIDKSGTMAGGGAGSVNTSVFKRQYAAASTASGKLIFSKELEEVERLKVRVQALSGEIDTMKKKKDALDNDLVALDAELRTHATTQTKATAELAAKERDVQAFFAALKELKTSELTEKEKKEQATLLKKLESLLAEQAKEQKRLSQLEKEVLKISTEIESVGGKERQCLKAALLKDQEQLAEITTNARESEVQSEVKARRGVQLQQLIPQKEAAIKAELDAEKSFAEQRDELTDKAEGVLKKKEELEEILKEQRKIEKEKELALKAKVSALKQSGLKEVEYQTKLQDLEHTLSGLRHTLKRHNKQLERFQEDWAAIPFIEPSSITVGGKSTCKDHDDESSPRAQSRPELEVDVPEEKLEALDEIIAACEIKKLTESTLSMKADISVIEKYRTLSEKLKERTVAFQDACQERDTKNKQLETLELSRLKEFTAGFTQISAAVQEMYQMITYDGDAELELADPSDPFRGGILFSVRPPKKSWKKIQNLSGGEKTLSSLALVFALHHYRPTPIYFMDEIDAALDHKNVSTIGLYIANQAKDAQFIIISLRTHMFELADRLVGIYKTSGITKSLTIDPDDFVVDDQRGGIASLSAVNTRALTAGTA